ncbi:hypothetical protein HUU51_01775 [Candidatus Gracilibacteria bacterium]|nr:hypothetical protein [Candidatus Gracilibacteria bacterium]
MSLLIFHNYNIMHPILVDKENALSSVQKSLDNALKEYEKGEYITLLSIK